MADVIPLFLVIGCSQSNLLPRYFRRTLPLQKKHFKHYQSLVMDAEQTHAALKFTVPKS